MKHRLLPVKKAALWFVVVGLLGAGFENLIIYSGAWNYTDSTVMNVPVWLFFVWGYAGTVAIPLYSGLMGKKLG